MKGKKKYLGVSQLHQPVTGNAAGNFELLAGHSRSAFQVSLTTAQLPVEPPPAGTARV